MIKADAMPPIKLGHLSAGTMAVSGLAMPSKMNACSELASQDCCCFGISGRRIPTSLVWGKTCETQMTAGPTRGHLLQGTKGRHQGSQGAETDTEQTLKVRSTGVPECRISRADTKTAEDQGHEDKNIFFP